MSYQSLHQGFLYGLQPESGSTLATIHETKTWLEKGTKQGRSLRGGLWNLSLSVRSPVPPPLNPQMKWHFVQGSMESRHFVPRWATTTRPPLPPPRFEKSGYASEPKSNVHGVGRPQKYLPKCNVFMVVKDSEIVIQEQSVFGGRRLQNSYPRVTYSWWR